VVFRLRPEKVPGAAEVAPSQRFVTGLKERGVLCGTFSAAEVRMVTHYEIGSADVEATLQAARDVLKLRVKSEK
jgi:threonine aldolase